MTNFKTVFISRTMPQFRIPIMEELDRQSPFDVLLIYAENRIPGEKSKTIAKSSLVRSRYLQFKTLNIPVLKNIYSVGYLDGITEILKNEKPGCVITEGESNFITNIIIWRYCVRNKIPFLWWSCGRVRNKPVSLMRKLVKPLLYRILNDSAGIIGYSSYAVDYYRKTYNLPEEKLFIAPNSVYSELDVKSATDATGLKRDLNIPEDAPVMMYVGALVPEKRPFYFIDIFRLLKRRIPNLYAVIVGDGQCKKEIDERFKNEEQLILTGHIKEKVNDYYQMADVFVLPGLGGLALQQAMMNGNAVVCGIADGTELDLVKNDINGYYIDSAKPISEWVDSIETILKTPDVKLKMQEASVDIIKNEFNYKIMISRIINAVKNVSETRSE